MKVTGTPTSLTANVTVAGKSPFTVTGTGETTNDAVFELVDAILKQIFKVPALCTRPIAYVLSSTSNTSKEIFLCNIDGSGLVSLGKLQAPKWMSNDMVVGMKTTDNGEVYTSGSIVVADLNGNSQTLTGDDVVAMYPLPASGKIAFSTPTGEAYIINLK